MKSFVYVISGEHGRQKIGSSDNPQQRLKDLQTASPYPLRFEFVGEVENGAGGQVEVEAHFTLNPHKAPGGDEWFVVPADVAITAVMAAAHRLGYRIKPVDTAQIAPQGFDHAGRQPTWVIATMVPFYAAFLWWDFYALIPQYEGGRIDLLSAFVMLGAAIGVLSLLQIIIRRYLGPGVARALYGSWLFPTKGP